MNLSDITHTSQLDWRFESHCFGACADAAKKIVNGTTVKIDVFNRSKDESTRISYVKSFYFGLCTIDNAPALRVSHTSNLDAHGTHSLIPSWNQQANDPVFISARLAVFLSREGSDWFVHQRS